MSDILDRARDFIAAFGEMTLYAGHPAVIVREMADRIETLERERDEAQRIARALTKALVGLTPGGSEYFTRSTLLDDYFADTERCVTVVRERYDSGHRAKLECVELRRDLTVALSSGSKT